MRVSSLLIALLLCASSVSASEFQTESSVEFIKKKKKKRRIRKVKRKKTAAKMSLHQKIKTAVIK